jgi:PIN domain nuclease of toxin-antitoxin system
VASLLLDTHAVHWPLNDDRHLGTVVREAFLAAPTVAISTVSVRVFAIKLSLGKLRFGLGAAQHQIPRDGFERLPVEDRHCRRYADLPALYRNSFDRMLSAQVFDQG